MVRFLRFWPPWRCAATGLCALGFALSAYLSWHYLMGAAVIGCGGGSPCEQVLGSRWSEIAGVLPVSGLAAGTYLAMLVCSFYLGPATAASDRRVAWAAMLVLAGAAAGSAVWFTILQEWVIGALCPYCMATHVAGLLLAALAIWRAPIGRLPASSLVLCGLTLTGVMAACQIAFPTPARRAVGTLRVASAQDMPSTESLPAAENQAVPSAPALDPRGAPLIGSPDAPFVVELFFDYKCPHCQKLHSMLDEAIARYGGKLAFALCPAPLNSQCNPYVARDVDEFKDSCELARISLAVWLAKREAFAAFDHWMFSPEPGHLWRPRSLEAASAKAAELAGSAKFKAARDDRWIDSYMKTAIQIYGDSISSGNAIPKLVFGTHWVIAEPNDLDDLVLILHSNLGVPGPLPSKPDSADHSGIK